MPSPDMMKALARTAGSGSPKFKTAIDAPSVTDLLLKELITEVRGLRRDLKAERMLPDTPFVRRIQSELATTRQEQSDA